MTSAQALTERAMLAGAMQKPAELRMLIDFLSERPAPGVVVEIGVGTGGMWPVWTTLAAPDALICGVSLSGGPFGGGDLSHIAPALFQLRRSEQTIALVADDSHSISTISELEGILDARSVDLLFIDGDHTLGGVLADYALYAPLVRPGGLVVFHDIVRHADPLIGVDVAWRALRRGQVCREFIDPAGGDWAGIGVIEQAVYYGGMV